MRIRSCLFYAHVHSNTIEFGFYLGLDIHLSTSVMMKKWTEEKEEQTIPLPRVSRYVTLKAYYVVFVDYRHKPSSSLRLFNSDSPNFQKNCADKCYTRFRQFIESKN